MQREPLLIAGAVGVAQHVEAAGAGAVADAGHAPVGAPAFAPDGGRGPDLSVGHAQQRDLGVGDVATAVAARERTEHVVAGASELAGEDRSETAGADDGNSTADERSFAVRAVHVYPLGRTTNAEGSD